MGIFGKRKGKAAKAPPPGEGIRDLAEDAPPPAEMNGQLGPPSDEALVPPPPPEPEMFTDAAPETGDPMQGEAAFPPPEPGAMGEAPPLDPLAPTGQVPPPPPPPPSFQPAPPPAPAPVEAAPAAPAAPSGDLAMAAPAPSVQAAGGLERLDSVEQRMSDMARRVDLLDRSSDDIRNDISRIRDSIAQIEGDMRELTSLYDLISTQINPFIDTSAMEEKAAISVDQGTIPDLDALFEPTPELAPGGEFEAVEEAPEETGARPEGAEGEPAEGEEGEAEVRPARPARLVRIGADASCHLALMEWIRYLLERVNRSEIPSVLSFYQRIGWISGEIKTDMLEIIRGVGDVTSEPAAPAGAGAAPSSGAKDESGDIVIAYGKEQARGLKGPAKEARGPAAGRGAAPAQPSTTWRLSPDDHVASLMYIEWIRSGGDLDRDKLEEIRREVSRLRSGLEGFFSL